MRLPGDALYSMENHSTALNVWERHGVQDAQCVHLDAHLDAGWFSVDAATTRNMSAVSSSELKERDCFLHTKEGHFDISSWIGVALFRRHVSRLFWVVPDEVWFQNSRRLQELLSRQVGHVTLDSYLQISGSVSPYRFVLESTEIIVCRLTELPSMKAGTLLLDVDLDYFARYHPAPSAENWSQPWTDPRRVVLDLQTRVPQASITTVSVSWHDGYVPNELMPYVLPLTEGSDQIVDGDVWDRHDDRLFGPYADYTRACGLLHRNFPPKRRLLPVALLWLHQMLAPISTPWRCAHLVSVTCLGRLRRWTNVCPAAQSGRRKCSMTSLGSVRASGASMRLSTSRRRPLTLICRVVHLSRAIS